MISFALMVQVTQHKIRQKKTINFSLETSRVEPNRTELMIAAYSTVDRI